MDVRTAQSILNSHGFPCGAADGVAGPTTKAAIQRFQEAYCGPGGWLTTDGVLGPQTAAALDWMRENNALVSYFTVAEVACRHCGLAYVKRELLAALFKLRQAVGPLSIADAYRCPTHNAQVGGASNSKHVSGEAADPTTYVTMDQARAAGFGGAGYPPSDRNRVDHVDIRPGWTTFPDTPH